MPPESREEGFSFTGHAMWSFREEPTLDFSMIDSKSSVVSISKYIHLGDSGPRIPEESPFLKKKVSLKQGSSLYSSSTRVCKLWPSTCFVWSII